MMDFFNKGDIILLKNGKKNKNTIAAKVIEHTDDSDEYVSNVEEWLRVETHYGAIIVFRGKYGCFEANKAKSLKGKIFRAELW